jgi:hypothetical protein
MAPFITWQVYGQPGSRLIDLVRPAEDFLLGNNASERLNATVWVGMSEHSFVLVIAP